MGYDADYYKQKAEAAKQKAKAFEKKAKQKSKAELAKKRELLCEAAIAFGKRYGHTDIDELILWISTLTPKKQQKEESQE